MLRHTRPIQIVAVITLGALLVLVPLSHVSAENGIYLPLIIANPPGAPTVTPTATRDPGVPQVVSIEPSSSKRVET